MSTRLRDLLLVAAAALVVTGAAIAASPRSGRAARAGLFAGVPQHGTVLGRPDAPVTVEEYADLQCPFCARFAGDVLPTVVADYVRAGRVRLVFRPLAFIGPDSVTAARVTVAAARQDRLWPFVERFYAEQGAENTGYVTDRFLREIGGGVPGLDTARALRVAPTDPITRELTANARRARELGIDSTPSFTVGPTGGTQRVLPVAELDPGAFRAALDAAMPAT